MRQEVLEPYRSRIWVGRISRCAGRKLPRAQASRSDRAQDHRRADCDVCIVKRHVLLHRDRISGRWRAARIAGLSSSVIGGEENSRQKSETKGRRVFIHPSSSAFIPGSSAAARKQTPPPSSSDVSACSRSRSRAIGTRPPRSPTRAARRCRRADVSESKVNRFFSSERDCPRCARAPRGPALVDPAARGPCGSCDIRRRRKCPPVGTIAQIPAIATPRSQSAARWAAAGSTLDEDRYHRTSSAGTRRG